MTENMWAAELNIYDLGPLQENLANPWNTLKTIQLLVFQVFMTFLFEFIWTLSSLHFCCFCLLKF